MTTNPDQSKAVGSTETPDEYLLEALGSKPETLEQDYLKAFVPNPTVKSLHILGTEPFLFGFSPLPPAWRSVQLALARVLSLPIKPGRNTWEPSTHLVYDSPSRYNPSLKKLLMALYYHQVQELVGEMNNAGADCRKQGDILRKLAGPLQRYTEAVDTAGAYPFELDPLRRTLCTFFEFTSAKTFGGVGPDPSYAYGAIDAFARAVMAIAGGLALLVPVILMTFLTAHHARLIISCCFVIMFAALIGIFTKATNQEVLAASAVYTAVLVVFVAAGI